MPLLFKHGALTTDQQSSVRHGVNKYPFPVLMNSQIDYKWIDKNLTEHEYVAESGMGGHYIKRSHLYMSMQVSCGWLYFLNDKHDYDAVCGLIAQMIDPNPFTTVIL